MQTKGDTTMTTQKRAVGRKAKNTTSQAPRGPTRAAPAPVPGDIVAMEEAIGMLKTTRPTFYRWLRAGRLKGMKVGRQWRFHRAEIERFLMGGEPAIELRADISPLMQQLERRARDLGVKAEPKAGESDLEQAVRL